LGAKAAPSLLTVAESSKHIIQITQLLEERTMSFSLCLNKTDTLILCGMALLYQTLDLKRDGKLKKDNEKLVNAVIQIVDKSKAFDSYDFKRVSGLLITLDEPLQPNTLPTPPRQSPEMSMAAPKSRPSPPASSASKPQPQATVGRHAFASASETDLLLQQEKLRRMTMPQIPGHGRPELYRGRSQPSADDLPQDQPMLRRDHRLSLNQAQAAMIARVSPAAMAIAKQNLDYLSLSSTPAQSQPSSPIQVRGQHQQHPGLAHLHQNQHPFATTHQKNTDISSSEWEALLGSLDGGQLNVYDAIYGGPALSMHETAPPTIISAATPRAPPSNAPSDQVSATADWSPDTWDLSAFNLGDLTSAPAHSVLSLSSAEDSLSSGEGVSPSEMGLSVSSLDYRSQLLGCAGPDGLILDALDANFGI
jgi:hypothetical protein